MDGVLFLESQKLSGWVKWMALLPIIVFLLIEILRQHRPSNREDAVGVYILLSILAAVMFLVYGFRLITEVRSDGVYIKFWPISWKFKRIGFEEIIRCYARKYRPIAEYGGWGIRWGGSGKAYNASGNMGVQLELINGKRLLIGSQQAEKLAETINAAMQKA
ncbi:MAG: hypothetical protein CVV39_08990 [Planctomycetes bacterium HGW-Planctomycetes-1]|nr:MAG: hypothetical protein CVV39_08990 [Planctomycetes bacterium HGW-Planctomycetes-1]